MSIQTINLGTYANDGTGDDLRTAFEKVNANLVELYSTVSGCSVGATPPTLGVEQGELWWSTVEGRLYIYFSGVWIDASPDVGFSINNYNLSDLGNVSDILPTVGQGLVWSGTEWVPGNVASGVDLDFGSFESPGGTFLDLGTF